MRCTATLGRVTRQVKVSPRPTGRPTSLAEVAYEAVRDRIVMLDIRPGAPINEDEVMRSLGVGRTPVREALKRLENERLVAVYPRRGTFATDVNITDLSHISEVRRLLEPAAAAKAAEHATQIDRDRLGEILDLLEAGSADQGGEEALRLDLSAHRAVYAATHNPYLEDTLIRYDNLATRIWCLFLDRLTTVAAHVNEHAALVRAVLDSDPDKASELAGQHVANFERAVRALL